ncbi:MAG TPA: PAS domain S-box protein, partial [Gammaproteobacteria bacterium]|nr:PAS domain S-box protein [Gammaproteobacteria bacterium]
ALTDITERKRWEQAIRDSEEQLRFVTDHAPALIVHCGADMRYKFVNAPYAKRYRMRPDEIVGKHIEEVVGKSAFKRLRPHVEAALGGQRAEFEERIVYDALGPRWISGFYVPQVEADGRVSGYFAAIHDVTRRRAAEEALRESEERFRNMADHAPVTIWVSEPDGRCSYMSKTWQDFTGQAPEESLGFGWLACVHPEDRDRIAEIRAVQAREPQASRNEYRLLTRRRDYRWVVDSVVPRTSPSGEFLGCIGSIVDITERKQMEEALRDADRRKDEFLATLSHELRNPLAPLRSSVELLRLTTDGDAESEPILDMMDRQVNHLVRLVDDLLEMSRISRGTFELRKERVGLGSVVANAIETSAPLIQAAAHTLVVSLPDEPVWLDGDPVRLAQILSNLLNNAAKYTSAGGEIALDTQCEDGVVAIAVKDNGRGIAIDMLPRLFEMFSRESRVGASEGGLGIGLALSRRLAEMHGGTIVAESQGPGRGSVFTVRLPRAGSGADEPTQQRRARLDAIARKRILVVDDNVDAADSLGMLLRLLGAEVRVARNGPEAIDVFASYEPCVVLLDIGMPGMDGYEVARRLRTSFPECDAKIVALTGWGQEDDRRRARDAGFDHHLIKPANVAALRALLASLDSETESPFASRSGAAARP